MTLNQRFAQARIAELGGEPTPADVAARDGELAWKIVGRGSCSIEWATTLIARHMAPERAEAQARIRELEADNSRLAAIVERLPKTATDPEPRYIKQREGGSLVCQWCGTFSSAATCHPCSMILTGTHPLTHQAAESVPTEETT